MGRRSRVTDIWKAAAASAGSLLGLGMTNIDLTDAAWTLYDPDSLVKSVAFSAGYNTVTWNTLASGSSDYEWAWGSNHRSPRWYKDLQIDGTTLTSDDLIMLGLMLQMDVTVDDFSQAVVAGACVDPTSTVAATINGGGICGLKLTGGNDAYGPWSNKAATTVGGGSAVKGFVSYLYGALYVPGGVVAALDSSGQYDARGSRTGDAAIATGTDLKFMVGVGTRGAVTVAEDDQQKFRLDLLSATVIQP